MERAETILGVQLPTEYLELLRIQNGGYVADEFDAFPTAVPTSWADDHVWFRTLAGIGPATSWPSVAVTAEMLRDWDLPPEVVPLSGDGHFWVALDYRTGGSPSVAWIDTEVGEDLILAPDFRTFLEGLVSMATFDEDD